MVLACYRDLEAGAHAGDDVGSWNLRFGVFIPSRGSEVLYLLANTVPAVREGH